VLWWSLCDTRSTTTCMSTEKDNAKTTWIKSIGSVRPKKINPESLNARTFMIVSYNILAESLSMSTIPWVLSLSKEMESKVDATLPNGKTWASLKKCQIADEYKKHWHKNFASGDYKRMRKLWGHGEFQGPSCIPSSCQGLSFVDSDTVAYGDTRAKTLRGVLREHLPPDLASEVFQDIVRRENAVYCWDVRGPRIFQQLTQRPWELTDGVRVERPDVICLQEYDVHRSVASYRGGSNDEEEAVTFDDAMRDAGYEGIFFNKPERYGGLAIWWRADRFEVDTMLPAERREHVASKPRRTRAFTDHEMSTSLRMFCGDTVVRFEDASVGTKASVVDSVHRKSPIPLAVWNYDLEENWRPPKWGGDVVERMRGADRRNFALVRLRAKHSSTRLWIGNAHLMTPSRDNERTTAISGEVRAGEIQTIGRTLRSHLEAFERERTDISRVVVVGDFNTAAEYAAKLPGNPLDLDAWRLSDGGADEHSLMEAFADAHRWTKDTTALRCTSKNAARTSWIDYQWFSASSLGVLAKTENRTPANPIPDETHPSDHLPIGVLYATRDA